MANEIKGKIEKIFDVQVISDKFSKLELVVQTDDKYPQSVPIQFTNANIAKLSGVKVGDAVTVQYNVRGKEYQGRYFVSLDGWQIAVNSSNNTPVIESAGHAKIEDDLDDMPF
jgi:hypothetical protein